MLKVKELRQEKNLTQKELAKLIGTTQASVSDWEVGKVEPSIEWLKRLSNFFNVSVDFIIGSEDDFGNVIENSEKNYTLEKDTREIIELYGKLDKEQRTFFIKALRGVTKN